MDCTTFLWETDEESEARASGRLAAAHRTHLGRHLRLAYPLPDDSPFGDLVRALNTPTSRP